MNEYPEKNSTPVDEQTETIDLFGERIDSSTPCADTDDTTSLAADRIGRAVDAAAERARKKKPVRNERQPHCEER